MLRGGGGLRISKFFWKKKNSFLFLMPPLRGCKWIWKARLAPDVCSDTDLCNKGIRRYMAPEVLDETLNKSGFEPFKAADMCGTNTEPCWMYLKPLKLRYLLLWCVLTMSCHTECHNIIINDVEREERPDQSTTRKPKFSSCCSVTN